MFEFETVYGIAQELAQASQMHLMTIIYWCDHDNWMATYSDDAGTSSVIIRTATQETLLQELREQYSEDGDAD